MTLTPDDIADLERFLKENGTTYAELKSIYVPVYSFLKRTSTQPATQDDIERILNTKFRMFQNTMVNTIHTQHKELSDLQQYTLLPVVETTKKIAESHIVKSSTDSNSQERGRSCELGYLEQMQQFPLLDMYDICDVSATNHNMDIEVVDPNSDKTPIGIEIKSHQSTVEKADIDKFLDDIRTTRKHGIMVASRAGIRGKENFQVLLEGDLMAVFLTHNNFDISQIYSAMEMIWSFDKLMKIKSLHIEGDGDRFREFDKLLRNELDSRTKKLAELDKAEKAIKQVKKLEETSTLEQIFKLFEVELVKVSGNNSRMGKRKAWCCHCGKSVSEGLKSDRACDTLESKMASHTCGNVKPLNVIVRNAEGIPKQELFVITSSTTTMKTAKVLLKKRADELNNLFTDTNSISQESIDTFGDNDDINPEVTDRFFDDIAD